MYPVGPGALGGAMRSRCNVPQQEGSRAPRSRVWQSCRADASSGRLQAAAELLHCQLRVHGNQGRPPHSTTTCLALCTNRAGPPPAPALPRSENNTGRFPRGLSLMLRSMAGAPRPAARPAHGSSPRTSLAGGHWPAQACCPAQRQPFPFPFPFPAPPCSLDLRPRPLPAPQVAGRPGEVQGAAGGRRGRVW